jgi:hypothetical protein
MIIGVSGKIGSGKDTVGNIIQYLTEPELQENSDCLDFLKNGFAMTQYPFTWQIKKFADKLKECASLILGIPREDLEKIEVKNRVLGKEWIRYGKANGFFIKGDERIMNNEPCSKEEYEIELKTNWQTTYKLEHTPRTILQLLGTEVGRFIHPDFWINALFVNYKLVSFQHSLIDHSGNSNPNIIMVGELMVVEFPNWIITDMRFPNELDSVKSRGGITIRVNRGIRCKDGLSDITNRMIQEIHPSETALDNAIFDYTIDNNGTIEELIEKVKEILIKEKII